MLASPSGSSVAGQDPAPVRTFATADAFFAAMFGPRQHDAHVVTRRHEMRLCAREAANKRGLAAIDDLMVELQAERAAQRVTDEAARIRVAAQYDEEIALRQALRAGGAS